MVVSTPENKTTGERRPSQEKGTMTEQPPQAVDSSANPAVASNANPAVENKQQSNAVLSSHSSFEKKEDKSLRLVTTPLQKGSRIMLSDEGMNMMPGVVTAIKGRTVTIVLDPEEVEGLPKQGSEVKDMVAVNQCKGVERKLRELKEAMLLECKRFKEDLSKTSFSAIWHDMLKELRLAYRDIASVFTKKGDKEKEKEKKRPSLAVSSAVKPEAKKSDQEMSPAINGETNSPSPLAAVTTDNKDDAQKQQEQAKDKDAADYKDQLVTLQEMGYKDALLLKQLLVSAKGDIPQVVTWLVAREKENAA
jgi:hypothetical protein